MPDEPNTRKKGILFVCTGNACRSQMAEGFAKKFAPDDIMVFSAGIAPAGVSSRASRVMKEAGVDISNQYSKGIEDIPLKEIGTVITLCSTVEKFCPSLPGKIRLHWPFPDPVGLSGAEEEVLLAFRKVRDAIKERIETFFKNKEYEGE